MKEALQNLENQETFNFSVALATKFAAKTTKESPQKTIIDVAEKHRIVTGAFPGLYSYSRTPYMHEPASLLSPRSSYRQITVMAAAQSGKTAGVI